MKICKFCGGKTEDNTTTCPNCGSADFSHICPNCSSEFDGSFCPTCGTRYDAVSTVCPQCNTRFFSKSCPNCGYNPDVLGRRVFSANMGNLTLIAFVFSVLGLMTFFFPLSIAGLVLALRERKKPESNGNTKMNQAAIIISAIALGLTALFVLSQGSMIVVSLLRNH